jgi:hypothetical protein
VLVGCEVRCSGGARLGVLVGRGCATLATAAPPALSLAVRRRSPDWAAATSARPRGIAVALLCCAPDVDIAHPRHPQPWRRAGRRPAADYPPAVPRCERIRTHDVRIRTHLVRCGERSSGPSCRAAR